MSANAWQKISFRAGSRVSENYTMSSFCYLGTCLIKLFSQVEFSSREKSNIFLKRSKKNVSKGFKSAIAFGLHDT